MLDRTRRDGDPTPSPVLVEKEVRSVSLPTGRVCRNKTWTPIMATVLPLTLYPIETQVEPQWLWAPASTAAISLRVPKWNYSQEADKLAATYSQRQCHEATGRDSVLPARGCMRMKVHMIKSTRGMIPFMGQGRGVTHMSFRREEQGLSHLHGGSHSPHNIT